MDSEDTQLIGEAVGWGGPLPGAAACDFATVRRHKSAALPGAIIMLPLRAAGMADHLGCAAFLAYGSGDSGEVGYVSFSVERRAAGDAGSRSRTVVVRCHSSPRRELGNGTRLQ